MSERGDDITRRRFMRAAAGSAAGIVGGTAAFLTACERQAELPTVAPDRTSSWGGTAPGAPVTRFPLRVPATVSPAALTLAAGPTTFDLGGGRMSNGLGYNGLVPGPVIRARNGDAANITVTNNLSEITSVHWHGMVVPDFADGGPQSAFAPNTKYDYRFRINQRACTNWYHPHPHMLTATQVYHGLAGMFVVNDGQELSLGLPSGAYEIPMILKDVKVDSAGNLAYSADHDGFLGSIPVVNGTRDPFLNVDTALYRVRLVNGSQSRIWHLSLSTGAPFVVIGNDGGLLYAPASATQIDFGPGERLDLLLDFRGLPVGTNVMLNSASASWDNWGGGDSFSVLEFRVVRQVNVSATIPSTLSTITKLTNPVRTRDFSFGGWPPHTINGLEYDMNRIDFVVPFGQTERWRFKWAQGATHPVHVHATSFQVQSRNGGRSQVAPWERGWKDTVLVGQRETVEIFLRFEAFRGVYMLHCHNLEHEDQGMMMNFKVV